MKKNNLIFFNQLFKNNKLLIIFEFYELLYLVYISIYSICFTYLIIFIFLNIWLLQRRISALSVKKEEFEGKEKKTAPESAYKKPAQARFIVFAFILALIVPACIYFSAYFVSPCTEAAEALPASTYRADIKAAGDIMLARKVGRYMAAQGVDYPVAQVAAFLQDADLTLCNLESPLSTKGTPLPGKGIWFRADPQNVEALTMCGIDLVALANNHALDYDSPALLETVDVLDEAGISHVGAGANEDAAREPVIKEINGIRIGFLSYSEMAEMYFSVTYPRKLKATDDLPGIASFNVDDIIDDIGELKDDTDIIILLLHWGTEYQDMPQQYQIEAAHKLIDNGADIIIGHHPHCIQGVETYHGGLIAYSLGNFIFDQEWSAKTKQGAVLSLELSPLSWAKASIYPVYIEEGKASIATGTEADEILGRLEEISRPLGTSFSRDEQGSYLHILPEGGE